MVGNHQTSIYKWLFGVPGRSLIFFGTCFLIPCENHDDFVNGGKGFFGDGVNSESVGAFSRTEGGVRFLV